MQAQCGEQTRNVLMPWLEEAIVDHLGRRSAGASRLRYEEDAIARYDLAVPGTLGALPADARLAALAHDCAQMRAMFIAPPPEFELEITCLTEAERRLNSLSAS